MKLRKWRRIMTETVTVFLDEGQNDHELFDLKDWESIDYIYKNRCKCQLFNYDNLLHSLLLRWVKTLFPEKVIGKIWVEKMFIHYKKSPYVPKNPDKKDDALKQNFWCYGLEIKIN
jgi:hypothetical protein